MVKRAPHLEHCRRRRIEEVGAERVLCVLSTTSCFAPRAVDKVLELGRLCKELGVPHIANNAYGVQCAACMKAIAARVRDLGGEDGVAGRYGGEEFIVIRVGLDQDEATRCDALCSEKR